MSKLKAVVSRNLRFGSAVQTQIIVQVNRRLFEESVNYRQCCVAFPIWALNRCMGSSYGSSYLSSINVPTQWFPSNRSTSMLEDTADKRVFFATCSTGFTSSGIAVSVVAAINTRLRYALHDYRDIIRDVTQ